MFEAIGVAPRPIFLGVSHLLGTLAVACEQRGREPLYFATWDQARPDDALPHEPQKRAPNWRGGHAERQPSQ